LTELGALRLISLIIDNYLSSKKYQSLPRYQRPASSSTPDIWTVVWKAQNYTAMIDIFYLFVFSPT